MKKLGKGSERPFSKEDAQVVNNHVTDAQHH